MAKLLKILVSFLKMLVNEEGKYVCIENAQ